MYKDIDYNTDTLEKIKKYELERATIFLRQLEEIGRLCSSEGRNIVYEYGFTGNLEEVIQKLSNWIKIVEKFGFSEADRKELKERYDRYIEFIYSEREDIYKINCLNAIREGNLSKTIKISDLGNARKKEMHDKKECICYNN